MHEGTVDAGGVGVDAILRSPSAILHSANGISTEWRLTMTARILL
jgi:hypothetical protein